MGAMKDLAIQRDEAGRKHAQKMADQAGLGAIMGAVFDVLADRGELPAEVAGRLTPLRVEHTYETFIAPGLDQLTDHFYSLSVLYAE